MGLFIFMAVRQGFEPWVRCRTHTFQACSFDHSDISPYKKRNSLVECNYTRLLETNAKAHPLLWRRATLKHNAAAVKECACGLPRYYLATSFNSCKAASASASLRFKPTTAPAVPLPDFSMSVIFCCSSDFSLALSSIANNNSRLSSVK